MFNKLKEMETKKKVIIGISSIIIIVIIIVGVVILFQPKQGKVEQEETPKMLGQIDLTKTDNAKIEDNKKINTSEELKKERTTSGLKIVDIALQTDNQLTSFTATVENTTTQAFKGNDIVIYLKNKEGKRYASMDGYIDEIQPGGRTYITSYTNEDVANAYDFEIQFQ